MKKVCIDAGHYGYYNRCPSNKNFWESKRMWELHLLQKKYLEQLGIGVVLTRSKQEKDLALQTRGKKAKGCDLFISDHSNAVGSKMNEGIDYVAVYHLTDDTRVTCDDKSKAIANKLAPVIAEVMGTEDGYKVLSRKAGNDRNGDGKLNDNYYGVLHGARMVNVPGLILEHSFHTCSKTVTWLLNDANLDKLARAEAECIASYLLGREVRLDGSRVPSTDISGNVQTEDKLEEDGKWGPKTTERSQRHFGTTVDGVISNQPKRNKKYLPNVYGWEFTSDYEDGSDMIRAMQTDLKEKGYYTGEIDGWCGKMTVEALQRFLRDLKLYEGEIDGSMGPLTVKAWQRYLNMQ